jgi:hypothetical protein
LNPGVLVGGNGGSHAGGANGFGKSVGVHVES